MPFKTILQDLVSGVPGARGAILADWEGEEVAHYTFDDEFQMKIVGAHKGIILSRLKEIHAQTGVPEPTVVEVASGTGAILIAAVGPDYCVVVTLGTRAFRGKAAYLLKKAVELLRKEIY